MAGASEIGSVAPKVAYWHVWADEARVTHHTLCALSAFKKESVGAEAAPEWINTLLTSEANVLFFVQPVGWVGEWRTNPKPQLIVTVSGHWFAKTMDGTRVEMAPAEVSLGSDHASKPDAQGQFGHRSGTVGEELLVLMVVRLAGEIWLGLSPCAFK